jgi:hypothetical protein
MKLLCTCLLAIMTALAVGAEGAPGMAWVARANSALPGSSPNYAFVPAGECSWYG